MRQSREQTWDHLLLAWIDFLHCSLALSPFFLQPIAFHFLLVGSLNQTHRQCFPGSCNPPSPVLLSPDSSFRELLPQALHLRTSAMLRCVLQRANNLRHSHPLASVTFRGKGWAWHSEPGHCCQGLWATSVFTRDLARSTCIVHQVGRCCGVLPRWFVFRRNMKDSG